MTIYGYRNVAYYPGSKRDGYACWFPSREARDTALAALREKAVGDGLSPSAARAGIYAITLHAADLTPGQQQEMDRDGYLQTA